MPIRISSPYLDQYMFEHIYKVDNKKKWVSKKGFSSLTKPNPVKNYIPNYVFTTPSMSPHDFKYRNNNAKSWITKKGFVYKNGKDFLLQLDDIEHNRLMVSSGINS
jgi:hypothetical protein